MADIGQVHNLPAFAENFLERGIAVREVPRFDSLPPRSAPYLLRWRWARRYAEAPSSGALAAAPPAAYARVYGMVSHSFRLET
jgi:hypothetical protein